MSFRSQKSSKIRAKMPGSPRRGARSSKTPSKRPETSITTINNLYLIEYKQNKAKMTISGNQECEIVPKLLTTGTLTCSNYVDDIYKEAYRPAKKKSKSSKKWKAKMERQINR